MVEAGNALAQAEAMTLLTPRQFTAKRNAAMIADLEGGMRQMDAAIKYGVSRALVSMIARAAGMGRRRRTLEEISAEHTKRTADLWRDIRDEWRQNNRAVMDGLIL